MTAGFKFKKSTCYLTNLKIQNLYAFNAPA